MNEPIPGEALVPQEPLATPADGHKREAMAAAATPATPVAPVAPDAFVAPVAPVANKAQARDDRDVDEDNDDDGDDDDEDDDDEPGGRSGKGRQRPVSHEAAEPIRFSDVVSGQFDADEEAPEVVISKRVLAPQAETPKLHKVLAQSGLGSRLEMEDRKSVV